MSTIHENRPFAREMPKFQQGLILRLGITTEERNCQQARRDM